MQSITARITIILLLSETGLLPAGLDLTGVAQRDARRHLQPVLEIVSADQTPPLLFLTADDNPWLGAGATLLTAAVPDFQSLDSGYPNFWLSTSVSPNLTIGAHFTGTSWKNDNLHTLGPFLVYSSGTPAKSTLFGFHFHNLKGPDDFHLTDVALDISRVHRNAKWHWGYGLTAHFLKTVFHVTDHTDADQNYRMTADFNIPFARLGAYHILWKNIALGVESFIRPDNMVTTMNFILTL